MTREELRNCVEGQRGLGNIPYCKFKENDTCVNVDSDKLADTVTDEDHCSDWRKRN